MSIDVRERTGSGFHFLVVKRLSSSVITLGRLNIFVFKVLSRGGERNVDTWTECGQCVAKGTPACNVVTLLSPSTCLVHTKY